MQLYLLQIIYFSQPRTNLFLQEFQKQYTVFVLFVGCFEVLTDLNDRRWTCSYLPDCDDTWFYRFLLYSDILSLF